MPVKKMRRSPGAFVLISLPDGTYGYGRVRDYGMSFYDFNTTEPVYNIELIASKNILFSVHVHKSAFKKWEIIGKLPLPDEIKKHIPTFRQSIGDPTKCTISDEGGYEKAVSPEECVGIEAAASWEDNHVEDRILDTIHGRKNVWYEMVKVKLPDE